VFAAMIAPLNVGLIGAGPWPRMVTGPVLAAGPETTVTGVWSRTAAHAAELADQLGVKSFADVDALLDTCDAVAISVAPAAQPALAVRAAGKGKTLLLEKPLADDVPGAHAIADAVQEAGVGALVMLSNRFNPAFDDFAAAAAQIEPSGGRGCFVSGAFLGGPFAYGWRLVRGAVLDVGPHLLDLLEAGLGPIVNVDARGDALGWVSMICTHTSGATSSASLCCAAASEGKTEIEVFGRAGAASYDGRLIDYNAWPARLRQSFVAVAGGATHGASVEQALHLQRLIAQIEAQLR
jgi:predicted dehydrogenase